jgi:hypothetical protein
MGLEQRKNNFYYYEKRRVGNCVVSQYVGGGLLAVVASQNAQGRKEDREARRTATEQQRAETLNLEAEIDRLLDNINTLSRGVFIASGYYQHNRQWRLRRDGNSGKHRNQAKAK